MASGISKHFTGQNILILLDFSKAFDKVAHEKLLSKLHFYGIRGNILNLIKDFLDNRAQSVILNGTNSDNIAVSSGVPQGSVLISKLTQRSYKRPRNPRKLGKALGHEL